MRLGLWLAAGLVPLRSKREAWRRELARSLRCSDRENEVKLVMREGEMRGIAFRW